MKPLELRRHRVLRLEVVNADGSSTRSYRTFCTRRQQSVPLETCCECVHCEQIDDDVVCVVPTNERTDPSGEETPVGMVIGDGALVVHGSTPLRDAKRLMHAEGRALIGVVDDDDSLIGVICDRPEYLDGREAASLTMSGPVNVTEATPVRAALRVLAATHLREVPVIASSGTPIGVFRDLDGLRWLTQAKSTKGR